MKNTKSSSYKQFKKPEIKPQRFKKRSEKVIVTFDDADRQEYLTGFHKRKIERKKQAVADIQKKMKEELKKVKEKRHITYMEMLKERTDALEEDKDDLEEVITATTESIQYDHPNHTVTVTTISDLDLSGPGSLFPDPSDNQVHGEGEKKEGGGGGEGRMVAMPKSKNAPILNKKIRDLSASLTKSTKSKKRKGKPRQESKRDRGTTVDKKHANEHVKTKPGRTTMKERRRRKGNRRYQD